MFVQTQKTPNPNSLKFLPGKKVSEDGSYEILNKDEAVDLESILKAYTVEGAYSLFRENEIGSLKKGKLADVILLDKNLFKIPPHEIHQAKVMMTIFNGRVVYSEKN